ncbi:MAG: CoA transferase [Deltaproteobacteria bacterium]|nr:CoA transferase [Deltaproteobacteria bacterium]MBW2418361.1 CoA transferase [Deltaproteobacteria bacterium]
MVTALEGVVVVDLTSEFFASLAGAMLGDFGATVIRVEDLSNPRKVDHDRDGMHPPERWNSLDELAHRNKQSLAVNLAEPEGREIFAKLISGADVFLTDLPFEALEQQGWGYESLCELKPDIVVARGSGFGPEGPDRDRPAYDELAAARAGSMPSMVQPGQPPVYTGIGQMQTAVLLAFGTVMALHHREESGEGQIVDASLLGGNMYSQSLDMQAYLAIRDDRFLEPVSRLDSGNPMSGPMYPSADGLWVALAMPDTGRYWPAFSGIVGLDVDDPRFDTHEKRCGENRLEMLQVLDELFRKQPGAHWKQELEANQLPADVIESYDYPTTDHNAALNRYILNLDHPTHGAIQSLGFPIYMSESPARLRNMAPCTGQHSAQILQEVLGYPSAQIEAFEASGIIHT